MSSRALRKLNDEPHSLLVNDSTHDETINSTTKSSIFSNFYLPTACELAEDNLGNSSDEDQTEQQPSVNTTSKSRKRRSRAKRKQKTQLEPLEDIDNLIADVVPKNNTNSTNQSSGTRVISMNLLAVNVKHLDPVTEFNRLFGSSRISKALDTSRRSQTITRGCFVRIKPGWPPVNRFGLDMTRLEEGATAYYFQFSKEYSNTQKLFYIALDSADPENLMNVLSKCPYHIDTLLQLSDLMMQQDNSEIGLDLLERALHAYQSALHTSFNPSLAQCRLDYRHETCRGLFVAIFRYLSINGERGCYQSSLEYCKLLLGLDFEGDPLAVVLVIDYYALLSNQWNFLIRFYDQWNDQRSLYLLPNFAYSIALARKFCELYPSNTSNEKGESSELMDPDELLQDALLMFPGFLSRLLRHTSLGGITNLDKSILFGQEVLKEPESLGRLLDLYVARTHLLWTSPEIKTWLERNVESVLLLVDPQKQSGVDPRFAVYQSRRQKLYPTLPRNVLRHLILSNLSDAPPLIPRSLQHNRIYPFDPLPPSDSVKIYDPEEDRRLRLREQTSGGWLSTLISSFLPSFAERQVDVVRAELANEGQLDEGASERTANGVEQGISTVFNRLASALQQMLDMIDLGDQGNGVPNAEDPEAANRREAEE